MENDKPKKQKTNENKKKTKQTNNKQEVKQKEVKQKENKRTKKDEEKTKGQTKTKDTKKTKNEIKNKETKIGKKNTKKQKQEKIVNPFKGEKSYLNEENKLEQYTKEFRQKEEILEQSKISKKDSFIFTTIIILIILICIGAYFLRSLIDKAFEVDFSDPIEITTTEYIAPFSIKAMDDISSKQLDNLVNSNNKMFKYMQIIKDKTTTKLSDDEKIQMLSYMLFYSNNDELMSYAKSNDDYTKIEIPISYLKKYAPKVFDGGINFEKLGLDDTYLFDNSIFFDECYIEVIRSCYDKDINYNVLELKTTSKVDGFTSNLVIYYLLDGNNFKICEIEVKQ